MIQSVSVRSTKDTEVIARPSLSFPLLVKKKDLLFHVLSEENGKIQVRKDLWASPVQEGSSSNFSQDLTQVTSGYFQV